MTVVILETDCEEVLPFFRKHEQRRDDYGFQIPPVDFLAVLDEINALVGNLNARLLRDKYEVDLIGDMNLARDVGGDVGARASDVIGLRAFVAGEEKENAGKQKYYDAHGGRIVPEGRWGLGPDLLNRNALAAKFARGGIFVVDGVQLGQIKERKFAESGDGRPRLVNCDRQADHLRAFRFQ